MQQMLRQLILAAIGTMPGPLFAETTMNQPVQGSMADQINLDTRYQVIDHFGASDCWTIQMIGIWSEPARRKVAELLFSQERGIGLSLWRVNLAGGPDKHIHDPLRAPESFEVSAGVYDWSRQPGARWFMRAAKEYGVPKFLAFCNSPPARLTRNGLTNHDDDKTHSTNLKPGAEGEFARYMVDILEHFRTNPDEAERIRFDWISPINEPQWDWTGNGQEGSRYSNADIKPVVVALGKELQQRQSPAKIHVIESGYIGDLVNLNEHATKQCHTEFGKYVDVLCGDADIAPHLHKIIGYHSYWSQSPDQLIAKRAELRRKLEAYPGWSVWQTEVCIMEQQRDLTMNMALRVAEIIHADLTVAQAAAWSWWLAVSPGDYKDGLIYTDYHKAGDEETVLPSKTLWVLGNYSRFVRPGMQRVALTPAKTPHPKLLGSAYVDDQNGKVVMVYTNLGDQPETIGLAVASQTSGLSVANWTPYITSDAPGDDLRQLPKVSANQTLNIPARSVVTFVSTR